MWRSRTSFNHTVILGERCEASRRAGAYRAACRSRPQRFFSAPCYLARQRRDRSLSRCMRRSDAGMRNAYSAFGDMENRRSSPGRGLFVGQTGVAANHHFVMSVHEPDYEFTAGSYTIEVFVRVVGIAETASSATSSYPLIAIWRSACVFARVSCLSANLVQTGMSATCEITTKERSREPSAVGGYHGDPLTAPIS
jgi:hypothetical protein